MRINVSHTTRFTYAQPGRGLIQTLRLTPRPHDGQHVVNWRIDVEPDCQLHQREDAFGNITHAFSLDGAVPEFSVTASGVIETVDTAGVLYGSVERFAPALFLRETPLTEADAAITAFAEEAVAGASGPLQRAHALNEALADAMAFDTLATEPATTAAEAFAAKRGVCQDLTHILIAAARHLGMPARYVGGYFKRNDGITRQLAGHAWAELYVEGFGWIGFDPTNRICPTEQHIRVAIGLDVLGATPIRGTAYGASGIHMEVSVDVYEARNQRTAQNQTQIQSPPFG